MKKKLMAVLGALSLVACGGSGKPWTGGDGPNLDQGSPTWGGSGPISVGGSSAVGGASGDDVDGGTPVGGATMSAGGYDVGGGTPVGGASMSAGGYDVGGATGSPSSLCAQNVVHCFDAAANCYEYSPWSDCDQIVDVCAAMQMDCDQ